jgi:hypothetical protein
MVRLCLGLNKRRGTEYPWSSSQTDMLTLRVEEALDLGQHLVELNLVQRADSHTAGC